jgi:hypothetical protein
VLYKMLIVHAQGRGAGDSGSVGGGCFVETGMDKEN